MHTREHQLPKVPQEHLAVKQTTNAAVGVAMNATDATDVRSLSTTKARSEDTATFTLADSLSQFAEVARQCLVPF